MNIACPASDKCLRSESSTGCARGCFRKIVDRWKAAVSSMIADGYENETGFHYGKEPLRDDKLTFNR
jgi:hypothetical protein